MGYFDTYKERVSAGGLSSSDAQINNTKSIINQTFTKSLSYKLVPIDGVNTDAIVNQGDDSSEKKLLFKPDVVVNKGAAVKIDGYDYLVIDFDTNGIYPTADLRICNALFPIKGEVTTIHMQDATGAYVYDDDGRPVMVTTELPASMISCIADSSAYTSRADSDQIKIPEDRLIVTLPCKTEIINKIKVNDMFVMYEDRYKITFIDYTQVINAKGLIQLTCTRVSDEAVNT